MNHFLIKFNNFFSNFEALGSLFLRLGVGVAFIIYGLGKFPLPPAGLTEYFGLSPSLASLVAISELPFSRSSSLGCFPCNSRFTPASTDTAGP